MFGGEVPELATTPCGACGQPVAEDDVVWDPYHEGERRFAALPYHRACAGAVLPPDAPTEAMTRCGLCGEALGEAEAAAAFEQLHARFRVAKAPAVPQQVVWRLAERDPRAFVAEHFACLVERVTGKKSPPEEPPGLPGVVINPDEGS